MSTVKVVHCKREKYDVYCGRPSLFGNPYKLRSGATDDDRRFCLIQYKLYFYSRLKRDIHFRKAVELLKGKVLGCFCSPKPCHCDVIAEYVDSLPPESPDTGANTY